MSKNPKFSAATRPNLPPPIHVTIFWSDSLKFTGWNPFAFGGMFSCISDDGLGFTPVLEKHSSNAFYYKIPNYIQIQTDFQFTLTSISVKIDSELHFNIKYFNLHPCVRVNLELHFHKVNFHLHNVLKFHEFIFMFHFDIK